MNNTILNLAVMADMAGCPNRCRHCWLAGHKNGHMTKDDLIQIARVFREWRGENGESIQNLAVFSWWREPDYRDDYRELWELEQRLSTPGHAERFELLSTWRLARDPSYACWAASLLPKTCQITFSGMEQNTDWFIRRKGAFRDQLLATGRLIDVGIAPRWQLFLTKRCLDDLPDFVRLIHEEKLFDRCEKIGRKFEVFIGGIAPEGYGFDLEDERIDAADLDAIPEELIALCRDGINLLGRPESEQLEALLREQRPPHVSIQTPALAVNADFNVYPNLAEPTEWWRLGNLHTDGIDQIMKTYLKEETPGMIANRTVPIAELTGRYGKADNNRLYTKGDLICRFLHQWGADYIKQK